MEDELGLAPVADRGQPLHDGAEEVEQVDLDHGGYGVAGLIGVGSWLGIWVMWPPGRSRPAK